MSLFSYSIKKYFRYTYKEALALFISIIILTLIAALDDGYQEFIAIRWLGNFFDVLIIIIIIMLTTNTVKKLIAIKKGYICEYNLWTWGLLVGIVVSLVTRGKIWFLLAPGGIVLHHVEKLRVGKHKFGHSFFEQGIIGMMGPITAFIIAIIFRLLLYLSPHSLVLHKAILISVVFAIVNSVPIPPLDGSHLFYASRKAYALFAICLIIACIFLFLMINIILTILAALIIGFLVWLIFMFAIEEK